MRRDFTSLLPLLLSVVASSCLSIRQDLTKKDCRRYVIYPPQHVDELVSDRIAHNWLRAMKDRPAKSQCDTIVSYASSKAFFMLEDIDNTEPLKTALADNAKRGRLFRRFGATHVIALAPQNIKGAEVITAEVYALSPFVKDSPRHLLTKLDLPAKEEKIIRHQHPWSSMFKRLNLLPNSVALGYSNSTLDNTLVTDKKVYLYSEEDRSSLPPIISSLWIGNISHRYSAGMWDLSAEWFGSLITRYTDSRMVLTPIGNPDSFDPDKVPPEERTVYTMVTFASVPVIGGELAFYSPLGTTFVSLSGGVGLAYSSDSLGGSQTKPVMALAIDLGHRIFFNDHIFTHLVVTAVSFTPDLVKNQYIAYQGRSTAMLGLGYYFPQVKTWARRMI